MYKFLNFAHNLTFDPITHLIEKHKKFEPIINNLSEKFKHFYVYVNEIYA